MPQLACKTSDCFKACLIFLCACVVYYPSIHNQFALDDLIHIVHNPAIQDSATWDQLFWSASYPGNLFRPVTNFSYALTFQFFGLTALPYHITNILLHAVTSMGVYFLLVRMGVRPLALAVGLLFAAHPIHVEAVANVSGRAELLAAFFVILSLHFFLAYAEAKSSRGKTLLPLIVASTCFFAALLCKESAATLLGLSVLVVCVHPRALKDLIPGFVCLGLLCLVFVVWRADVLGTATIATSDTELLDNPLAALQVAPRIVMALSLLGKYISLCVIPFPLSADYSFAVIDPGGFWGIVQNCLNLLLTLILGVLSVLAFRKDKTLWFFAIWFLVSFAITANILFPIGTVFAERLTYLPSIGIIGLLVLCAQRYLKLPTCRLALCLLGLVYFVETWRHSPVWQDNESLHSYQMSVSPQSAKTLVNFGMVVRNRGDPQAASAYFRQALQIYPRFANAAYGLGSTYALKGMQSGAEHWYHEALKISPSHVPSLEALGRLYLNNGKTAEARLQFEKVLRIEGNSIRARVGLLALLLREDKLEEAKQMRDNLAPLAHDDAEYQRLSELLDQNVAQ